MYVGWPGCCCSVVRRFFVRRSSSRVTIISYSKQLTQEQGTLSCVEKHTSRCVARVQCVFVKQGAQGAAATARPCGRVRLLPVQHGLAHFVLAAAAAGVPGFM